eukprot:m.334234 g.334234  ORF g.334234 m.334234 type:complete len:1206 (-) comp17317_c0_seq1:156-3773(-)
MVKFAVLFAAVVALAGFTVNAVQFECPEAIIEYDSCISPTATMVQEMTTSSITFSGGEYATISFSAPQGAGNQFRISLVKPPSANMPEIERILLDHIPPVTPSIFQGEANQTQMYKISVQFPDVDCDDCLIKITSPEVTMGSCNILPPACDLLTSTTTTTSTVTTSTATVTNGSMVQTTGSDGNSTGTTSIMNTTATTTTTQTTGTMDMGNATVSPSFVAAFDGNGSAFRAFAGQTLNLTLLYYNVTTPLPMPGLLFVVDTSITSCDNVTTVDNSSASTYSKPLPFTSNADFFDLDEGDFEALNGSVAYIGVLGEPPMGCSVFQSSTPGRGRRVEHLGNHTNMTDSNATDTHNGTMSMNNSSSMNSTTTNPMNTQTTSTATTTTDPDACGSVLCSFARVKIVSRSSNDFICGSDQYEHYEDEIKENHWPFVGAAAGTSRTYTANYYANWNFEGFIESSNNLNGVVAAVPSVYSQNCGSCGDALVQCSVDSSTIDNKDSSEGYEYVRLKETINGVAALRQPDFNMSHEDHAEEHHEEEVDHNSHRNLFLPLTDYNAEEHVAGIMHFELKYERINTYILRYHFNVEYLDHYNFASPTMKLFVGYATDALLLGGYVVGRKLSSSPFFTKELTSPSNKLQTFSGMITLDNQQAIAILSEKVYVQIEGSMMNGMAAELQGQLRVGNIATGMTMFNNGAPGSMFSFLRLADNDPEHLEYAVSADASQTSKNAGLQESVSQITLDLGNGPKNLTLQHEYCGSGFLMPSEAELNDAIKSNNTVTMRVVQLIPGEKRTFMIKSEMGSLRMPQYKLGYGKLYAQRNGELEGIVLFQLDSLGMLHYFMITDGLDGDPTPDHISFTFDAVKRGLRFDATDFYTVPSTLDGYLKTGMWFVPDKFYNTQVKKAILDGKSSVEIRTSEGLKEYENVELTADVTFANVVQALCLGINETVDIVAAFSNSDNKLNYMVTVRGSERVEKVMFMYAKNDTIMLNTSTCEETICALDGSLGPDFQEELDKKNVHVGVKLDGMDNMYMCMFDVYNSEDIIIEPTTPAFAGNNTTTTGVQQTSKSDDGLSGGAIAGIIVVALLLIGGGIGAVIFFKKKNSGPAPKKLSNQRYNEGGNFEAEEFSNPLAGGGDTTTNNGAYEPPAMAEPSQMESKPPAAPANSGGSPNVWVALTEDGTGDTYYFNKATEETTWDHPGAGATIIPESEA